MSSARGPTAPPSSGSGALRATTSSAPPEEVARDSLESFDASAAGSGALRTLGALASAGASSPPLESSASSATGGGGAAAGFFAPDGARPRSTAEPRRRENPSRTSEATLAGLLPANEPSPLTAPSAPLRTVSLAFFFPTSPV